MLFASFQLHGIDILLIGQHWLRLDCDTILDDIHALHSNRYVGYTIEHVVKSSYSKFIAESLMKFC